MPELKNVNATNTTITIAGGMKNMNSLYDRLKPEVIEKLNDLAQEFPLTIDDIYTDLKKNKFIADLRYDTILNIGDNIFNNINITYFEIDKLFNHE
jgi:hypothetical protein